jgi:hypothetical protein
MNRLIALFVGFVGMLAVAAPSLAQTGSPAATPMPIVGLGMTLPEYQGMGCLTAGVIAATGVFIYSDVITAAVSGVVNPVLLIPVVATGFAVGCGVGATLSPGFLWIGKVITGS